MIRLVVQISIRCHVIVRYPAPVVPLTIESWNLDSPRNMGTNEVTWRVTISGASRTSEYIVCNVDCCRLCSSHDKDCINKGINWGKIKITKKELMQTASSLDFSSYLVRGRRERRRAAARDEKKKHLLSRLQSLAWSFSWLARFVQRTKKKRVCS